jgi:hypothetical protein
MVPQLKLDDIEQEVVAALRKIGGRPRQWHQRRFTRKVMKAIGGAGERIRFVVATADSKVGQDHEWLYDLCWCKEADGFILSLSLALECEWAQDFSAILDDFQKLVVSRAEHRVLVCSQPAEDWPDCITFLVEQINRFNGSKDGDRYLFGSWTTRGWEFQQYVHPALIERPKHVWLFGANKEWYDLTKEVKRRKGHDWNVECYREHRLRPGDTVLLWQSGADAGIYSLGELTSEVYRSGKKWLVDIRYDHRYNHLLTSPLLKSDLCKDPVLKNLNIIRMPRGRNPFRIYDEQWEALRKLIPVETAAGKGGQP